MKWNDDQYRSPSSLPLFCRALQRAVVHPRARLQAYLSATLGLSASLSNAGLAGFVVSLMEDSNLASSGGCMAEVKITIRKNGPYLVEGPVSLVDADGNPYDLTGKAKFSL